MEKCGDIGGDSLKPGCQAVEAVEAVEASKK
jgi:hypothetical protein